MERLWGASAAERVMTVILLAGLGVLSAACGSSSSGKTSIATIAPTTSTTGVRSVAAWKAAYGHIFGTLGNDLTSVGKEATSGNFSGTQDACQRLHDDVQTAQSYPPIPDSSVNSHWQAALQALHNAGQDCVDGVQSRNEQLLTKTAQELQQAEPDLTQAAQAVTGSGSP